MKRALITILLSLALLGAVAISCASETSVTGQFYGCTEATDTNGNTNTYYQFKANDNSVWWQLTAEEIGFVPNANKEYTLTYDNNGTTKANKPCDCGPEFECECEVYDDIFLGVQAK